MEPTPATEAKGPKVPPTYPPKTPPPPKSPPSPWPPDPKNPQQGLPAPRHGGWPMMANRRGVNWPLEAQAWSAKTARRRVLEQLRQWGHTVDETAVGDLVEHLARTAVQDGGSRISLHLSDQDGQALILLLSHLPGLAPANEDALRAIAAHGPLNCGTHTDDDGRTVWALIDLTPPRRLAVKPAHQLPAAR